MNRLLLNRAKIIFSFLKIVHTTPKAPAGVCALRKTVLLYYRIGQKDAKRERCFKKAMLLQLEKLCCQASLDTTAKIKL